MNKLTKIDMNKQAKPMKIIITALLSIAFFGCGGGGSSKPDPDPLPIVEEKPTCAGTVLEAENQCITLNNRESILYQKNTENKDGIAIFLHGSPGNAKKVMGIFDAKMLAETYNLVALSPEGTTLTWGWLSSNKSSDDSNRDVDYLTELISKVKGDYNVTTDKVYIFGYSAGGFMAYKLACVIPEQITAVISLAGQFRGSLDACSTSTAVSIHHLHSTSDREVPFIGRQTGNILSVSKTIAHWQQKNGCDADFETIEHPGVTEASANTVTERYKNCDKTVALSKMTAVAHESNYLANKLLEIYGYLLADD